MSTIDPDEALRFLQQEYQATHWMNKKLELEDRLDDLWIDSLGAQELLTAVEERLGLNLLTDAMTTRVESVGDMVDLIVANSQALDGRT